MKKVIIIIAAVCVCIAVALGMFRMNSSKAICGEWKIQYVTDENGKMILCCPEELDMHPDADESNMTLVADNEQLAISENDMVLTGTYAYNNSNIAGTIYRIEIQDEDAIYQGLAVASSEVVSGAAKKEVLTISLLYGNKNYSMFFSK